MFAFIVLYFFPCWKYFRLSGLFFADISDNKSNQEPLNTHHKYEVSEINNHNEVIEILLQNHADINIKNNRRETALSLAVISGKKDIVATLLRNGAYANIKKRDGFTPLLEAVWRGYKDIAKILLENGAKINAKGCCHDWTELISAIDRHNIKPDKELRASFKIQ